MFREVVQLLIYLLERIGILVIVTGFLVDTLMWLRCLYGRSMHENYVAYRRQSVRGLILGMIVLIRSFLVFTLHLEMRNHAD